MNDIDNKQGAGNAFVKTLLMTDAAGAMLAGMPQTVTVPFNHNRCEILVSQATTVTAGVVKVNEITENPSFGSSPLTVPRVLITCAVNLTGNSATFNIARGVTNTITASLAAYAGAGAVGVVLRTWEEC